MTATPLVELKQLSKQYSGVPVVIDVDFDVQAGEVHALLGENGAGKSTLTKMMSGVVTPTSGTMLVQGERAEFANPREALEAGVAMVFQETSLVPSMTVAQNLYLGRERAFNRLRGLFISAQQFLQSLNFDVDPTRRVSELGAAKKQMVEIARAVLHRAKVIVFDEPTASLTPEEKLHFFKLVKDLKKRGVGIVFISHALEESLAIADRITVMRDGRRVLSAPAAELDRAAIVRAMVGREGVGQSARAGRVRPAGARVLSVQNLRMAGVVKNTSFSVFAGQVTGVFGLVGSGRTETFKIVAGALKRDWRHGGRVMLGERSVRYRTPRQAVGDGIAYVTEDRKVEGFFETMSIGTNIDVGAQVRSRRWAWWRDFPGARQQASQWIAALNIRAAGGDAKVIELSGGNQQKVVIAKSLVQQPQLIIFDEPTRGVDVGAIEEIHALIGKLADEGKAVVVISSYLPEVMKLSDRLLVVKQGRVVEEFEGTQATEESVMYAAIH